ncbi:MAG: hypothetical protein WBI06_06655 [Paludibacter sp.]
MEKALFYLIIIFDICYLYQYYVYPQQLFIGSDVLEVMKDVRIRMKGQGLVFIGIFLGLNKYLQNTKRYEFLVLFFINLSILFLLGFRTQLLVIAITLMYLYWKVVGINKKLFIYISIFSIISFITYNNSELLQKKLNFLIERNETDNFYNSDYGRFSTLNYYINEHFKNSFEYFWGSGLPSESSVYGRYILKLKDSFIIYADWGFLGFSWMIGIPLTLFFLIFSIKAISIKVDKRYTYLSIWILFILLSTIFTREFFRNGSFLLQAYVLYMIEKSNSGIIKKQIRKTISIYMPDVTKNMETTTLVKKNIEKENDAN